MAPFLGVAVGAALTMEIIPAFGIFTSVAIGLSFPYLSAFHLPRLDKQFKARAWMDTFKQAMAFPALRNRCLVALDFGRPPLARERSDRIELLRELRPLLAGSDSNRLLDGENKDFSVSNFLGLGGFRNCIDYLVAQIIGNDDLDHDFRQEIDGVFAAAVNFSMSLLPSKALCLQDGHSFHSNLR